MAANLPPDIMPLRRHLERLLALPSSEAGPVVKLVGWWFCAQAFEDGSCVRREPLEDVARSLGIVCKGKQSWRNVSEALARLGELGWSRREKERGLTVTVLLVDGAVPVETLLGSASTVSHGSGGSGGSDATESRLRRHPVPPETLPGPASTATARPVSGGIVGGCSNSILSSTAESTGATDGAGRHEDDSRESNDGGRDLGRPGARGRDVPRMRRGGSSLGRDQAAGREPEPERLLGVPAASQQDVQGEAEAVAPTAPSASDKPVSTAGGGSGTNSTPHGAAGEQQAGARGGGDLRPGPHDGPRQDGLRDLGALPPSASEPAWHVGGGSGVGLPSGRDRQPEEVTAPAANSPRAFVGASQPVSEWPDGDCKSQAYPGSGDGSLDNDASTGRPGGSRPERIGAPTLTLTSPEAPKRGRRGKQERQAKADVWPPTLDRLAAVVAVLDALGAARKAAGWPKPHAASAELRKALEAGRVPPTGSADAATILRRLVELEGEDGEGVEAARDVLVAVVQAKVAEHRRKDGEHATGRHAVIETILARKAWWPGNLAAGRAWLASGGRAAARVERGRTFVRHAEEESLV